jgi:hypothetical protein
MNGGTALALGVAGIATAEATGATNLLGPDRETPDPRLPTPDNGPSMDAVLQAITAASQSGDSGGGIDAGGIAQAVASAAQAGAQAGGETDALRSVLDSNRDLVSALQEQRERAENAAEEAGDPPEWLQNADVPGTGEDGKNGKNGNGTPNDDNSDSYDLQKDYGGPFAEVIGGGAETLEETGNVVNEARDAPTDAVEWSARSGRTVGEAWRLVTTGEATGDGTFASDGRKTFDFSGDGNAGGPLSERLFSGRDDEGTPQGGVLGEGGFFDSLDGSVTESLGRQFDSESGGGPSDMVANALGEGNTAFERADSGPQEDQHPNTEPALRSADPTRSGGSGSSQSGSKGPIERLREVAEI